MHSLIKQPLIMHNLNGCSSTQRLTSLYFKDKIDFNHQQNINCAMQLRVFLAFANTQSPDQGLYLHSMTLAVRWYISVVTNT